MEVKVSSVREENDTLYFTISNLDVCFANTIRRTILSDIETIIFKTMPYEQNQCNIYENTTKLNNEIIKQRLGCIPIHISDIKTPLDNLLMTLEVENKDDNIKIVTTEDFKIKIGDKFLPDSKVKEIFPPYIGPTNSEQYYIDIVRLTPKISDTIPGNKIKLDCKFSIGKSKDDSMYNVVSTCSYGNTLDEEQINIILQQKMKQLKEQGKTKEEIAFEVNNWKVLEAKRIFKKNSYDFKIKSLGVFDNKDLVKKACVIVQDKSVLLLDELQSGNTSILKSETTMDNCYDILIKDEYYEIASILNYLIYTDYYNNDNKVVTFIGFKKMHPHNDNSTLRIAFAADHDGENTIIKIIEECIKRNVNLFQKINKLF